MKIGLAFHGEVLADWQRQLGGAGLDLVGCPSLAALTAAAPEIIAGSASGYLLDYLKTRPAQLRWVHFVNAGIERAVAALGTAPGFLISNGRGVHSEPMAEFVLGAMLQWVKRAPQWAAAQRAHQWTPGDVGTLRGRVLVVVGAGSIGGAIAEKAKAFGMHVLGIASHDGPRPHFDEVATAARLHEMLGRADFVALALPATAATAGMIDAAAFAAMKPGAVLINVGRGSAVDEAALLAALASGRLGGAALDTVAEEPLPAASPLWDAPNLILTPHVSGRFDGGDVARALLFLENYRRFAADGTLATPVDPARGY